MFCFSAADLTHTSTDSGISTHLWMNALLDNSSSWCYFLRDHWPLFWTREVGSLKEISFYMGRAHWWEDSSYSLGWERLAHGAVCSEFIINAKISASSPVQAFHYVCGVFHPNTSAWSALSAGSFSCWFPTTMVPSFSGFKKFTPIFSLKITFPLICICLNELSLLYTFACLLLVSEW